MKKAALIALAFLVSIPLGLAAQTDDAAGVPADGYYAGSFARLTYVQGEVFVQRTSDLGTVRGEVNLALVQGDKLATGAGQAEVQFGGRNYLRLAENSKVEFAALPTDADGHVKIHVLEGSAYLRVGSLSGEKAFEVHSPDASFYVLEEGLYRFNVVANGQTEVLVTEGSLEAAGQEGSVVVHAGESVSAEDGRLLGQPAYSNARPDAFDQWNASRDALYAQRSNSRYLPSELDEYQEELDQNGHWTYEQPYGYVWAPYIVDSGWRPYYYGHWSWYPLIGWTWISSEPWGWSVYHYGRWHWRFGLGWYWIPHWGFGPAWVNWWWDNDYVGWCPLSWYNRPVVVVGNSFYDRYRNPYFPHDNRAMTVIRRDRLQAPDVAHHVVRGDELRGLDRISLRASQPGIRPSIGRSSLQSPEAQRVFSSRPGIRSEAKNYAPGNSVTSSRLRQGQAGAPVAGSNGAGASQGRISERTIRVYPSGQGSSSSRSGPGAGYRSDGVTRQPGTSSQRPGESSGRVYPSRQGTAVSPRSVERPTGGARPSGSEVNSGEKVRHYPSSTGQGASSLSARTSSSSWGGAVRPDASLYARTYPSRLGQGNASGSRTVREYSSSLPRSSYAMPSRSSVAPSESSSRSTSRTPRFDPRSYSYSRPSSPSYARSGGSRYGAPSQPRSSYSYSAPSRSGGYSGRSSSAPRYSSGSRGGSSVSSRSSSHSSSGHSSARTKG